MKDITAELVNFALSLRLDDLPPSVVAVAKRHILDTLVVARTAADADGVESMLHWAQVESVAGTATVWSHDCRLRPGHAAFVNAIAAAALEFDTLCLSVHADNVIVPAAFAIAEDRRANGESFLSACIVGTEIMARLAHASIPPQKGWNHTTVFGVFGAALAAARLAGLTAEQAANAFGICLSLAAGTQQPNFEQRLTKRMQPALAVRNGIFAVEAAQHGITGPHAAIEGKAGLWSLYQAGDRERLLAGLGRDYVLLQTGIKKYPVCACSHAAIDACFALSGGKTLSCENIEAIEVTLTPFMARLVGGSFEPDGNPVVTAQFSVGYALACVLLRGHVDLSDLAPEAIADERVASLARRVVVHVDPGATGELAPAKVRLKTSSLGDRTHTVASMPGAADLPLTERAFDEKLEACDRINPFVARLGGLAALKRGIEQIEKSDHISSLAALMGARGVSRTTSVPQAHGKRGALRGARS